MYRAQQPCQSSTLYTIKTDTPKDIAKQRVSWLPQTSYISSDPITTHTLDRKTRPNSSWTTQAKNSRPQAYPSKANAIKKPQQANIPMTINAATKASRILEDALCSRRGEDLECNRRPVTKVPYLCGLWLVFFSISFSTEDFVS
jgi:hypothetical protein